MIPQAILKLAFIIDQKLGKPRTREHNEVQLTSANHRMQQLWAVRSTLVKNG